MDLSCRPSTSCIVRTPKRRSTDPPRRARLCSQDCSVGECGIALVLVLSLLAVISVMALHMAVSSEVTALEAKVVADRGMLKYAAESATERAFWMYVCDRRSFPGDHRNLMTVPSIRETDPEGEIWRADGRPHDVDVGDVRVRVAILDADSGHDLSGGNPTSRLKTDLRSDDLDRQAEIDAFVDVLMDYIDGDDLTRAGGWERADYEAIGQPALPRNGALQFREEGLWLEGFAKNILGLDENSAGVGKGVDAVRVIPPPGQAFPRRSKPSLFATDPSIIQSSLSLTNEELQQVIDARNAYFSQGTAISEILLPGLVSRLSSKYAVDESGVATITAVASVLDGKIQRRLSVTRNCDARTLKVRQGGEAFIGTWEKVIH